MDPLLIGIAVVAILIIAGIVYFNRHKFSSASTDGAKKFDASDDKTLTDNQLLAAQINAVAKSAN